MQTLFKSGNQVTGRGQCQMLSELSKFMCQAAEVESHAWQPLDKGKQTKGLKGKETDRSQLCYRLRLNTPVSPSLPLSLPPIRFFHVISQAQEQSMLVRHPSGGEEEDCSAFGHGHSGNLQTTLTKRQYNTLWQLKVALRFYCRLCLLTKGREKKKQNGKSGQITQLPYNGKQHVIINWF